jgi:hypothetical protein
MMELACKLMIDVIVVAVSLRDDIGDDIGFFKQHGKQLMRLDVMIDD